MRWVAVFTRDLQIHQTTYRRCLWRTQNRSSLNCFLYTTTTTGKEVPNFRQSELVKGTSIDWQRSYSQRPNIPPIPMAPPRDEQDWVWSYRLSGSLLSGEGVLMDFIEHSFELLMCPGKSCAPPWDWWWSDAFPLSSHCCSFVTHTVDIIIIWTYLERLTSSSSNISATQGCYRILNWSKSNRSTWV
jgi:hypothetical protein